MNNLNSTKFTGDVTVSGSVNNVPNSIFPYLTGITSAVQSQLSNLKVKTQNQSFITGSNTTSFSGKVSVTGTLQGLSNTIYGYLPNISSDVQSQFTTLTNNLATTNSFFK